MKIIKRITQLDRVLVIYYTSGKCYQFAIINAHSIQKPNSIFYTASGAESEGKNFLNQLS